MKLKPLSDQVMVNVGASSGIGLATARRAAAAGARVVLAARNSDALDEAVVAIRNKGGEATALDLDIADEGSAERLLAYALDRYGRVDTWVNDAAAAIFARVEDVSLAEHRRVFDVGYFGLVDASLVAIGHLRKEGGALINIGSVLSNRAIPLQGPYCAMKAAVMQFTDALRMELEQEGAPISVTLIKPAAIDTMYPEHARNKLDRHARLPQPLYDAELVAKAICFAAQTPRRTLVVGGGGLALTTLAPALPRLADKGMVLVGGEASQTTDVPPAPGTSDNLFEPRRDGRVEGNQEPFKRRTSLYLEAQMHPYATAAVLSSMAAGALFLWAREESRDIGTEEAKRRIRAAGMS
ncbi:SDR family oxidoreductase [Sphingomonas sp. LHG3406-1]|uniref:SDR family oxidoreductase n=1 Tax=Sphingomonas sp. LHG3406-1 TaxID=2804617 RepID=UPI002609F055|nr:SDR family oxidoreductase [Sphingomonas sp. LHG3406-1]